MEFVIGTCNIRYAADDRENHWSSRLPLLAKALRGAAPALLGTQEGWEWQLRELEEKLPNHRIVDDNRYWMEERMYPTLFVSRDVEVHKGGDVWLSETPDLPGSRSFGSLYPRLMCWAEVSVGDAPPFICANLHLDHQSPETRVSQIDVALTRLGELLRPGMPLCLLGDFNDPPGGAVARAIIRRGSALGVHLYDPWQELELPESSSYHGYGMAEEDWSRIDWILLSDQFETIDIDYERTAEPPLYPSDHYPVIARVRLK
ncbi:MAG: endonuclease/exonuclease/phosphatase family protein [Spirochaetaceae bacterium]